MKPKPFSLRLRFLLMQAGSLLLGLWLVAGALYLSQALHDRLATSLKDLHSALALNTAIESADKALMQGFWTSYFHPRESARVEYDAAVQNLRQLTGSYSRVDLSTDEQRNVTALQQEGSELLRMTDQLLASSNRLPNASAQLGQVARLNHQFESTLGRIADAQLERLHVSTAQLHQYTQTLYLLLLAFAVSTIVVIYSFRYVHQRQLWAPIEDLRQMLLQVRRGNLDASGEIPHSVELRPLVEAFLSMTAELREMRGGLEQKVRERTAELEAAQTQLLQAAKLSSLGQLVSGVAHEINNPLTSILGFSEVLLARPDLNPTAKSQVQTIRDESLRLKNLVANLSSFARRGPHRTMRVDLRGILDRLIELRRYQLAANSIEIHYSPPEEPLWVEADPDQLLQVFFNLVLNAEQAITACRTKGEIRLSCGQDAGHAWATVEDNGAGIPEGILNRIFDPFFTTKPAGQRTGLGLSISHGIIDQHQGRIDVNSVEGKGTKVRVALPLAPPEPATPLKPVVSKTVPAEPAASTATHVLVIDDEVAITNLIEQVLAKYGWHLTLLNDPTTVESLLDQNDFDLVLCDLKMPGKSGLEILSLLRQKRPELAQRFLLLTGNLSDTEGRGPALAGIPIVRKPFTLTQLRNAVDALMKKS